MTKTENTEKKNKVKAPKPTLGAQYLDASEVQRHQALLDEYEFNDLCELTLALSNGAEHRYEVSALRTSAMRGLCVTESVREVGTRSYVIRPCQFRISHYSSGLRVWPRMLNDVQSAIDIAVQLATIMDWRQSPEKIRAVLSTKNGTERNQLWAYADSCGVNLDAWVRKIPAMPETRDGEPIGSHKGSSNKPKLLYKAECRTCGYQKPWEEGDERTQVICAFCDSPGGYREVEEEVR